MSDYRLNSDATPFTVYADCPASDECDYCDEGSEFAAGHTHALYETREGASLHTADELADLFLDAVEYLVATPSDPWQRPEYCPRDVSGWCEDPDDAQALADTIALGESVLAEIGLYVSWDDGYVIERVVERDEIEPDWDALSDGRAVGDDRGEFQRGYYHGLGRGAFMGEPDPDLPYDAGYAAGVAAADNGEDAGECTVLVEIIGAPNGELVGTCACGRPIYRSHLAGTIYHATEGE